MLIYVCFNTLFFLQVSDQQNTLDRAGVPGFILSNKEFDIKLQMYLLGFISELSRREEMEKNSL